MHTELNRVKQLLVNNGFTNTEIDQEIHKQLEKQQTQKQTTEPRSNKTHHLYYKNHMNSQYKTDEKILNPRPSSVFRHLPQCRGGGWCDPPGVSKLSVVELSRKNSGLLSTSTRDW